MGALLDIAASVPVRDAAATERGATRAEDAELRRLITIVLADAPHEHEEALAVALANMDNALTCYRALAANLPANGHE
jgi:hypothetical protein